VFSDESDISDCDLDIDAARQHKNSFRSECRPLSPEMRRSPLPPQTSQLQPSTQGSFPLLSHPKELKDADVLDAISKYALQGSFAIDGGCKRKRGSHAFVGFTASHCCLQAVFSEGASTNNQMEFQALLLAIRKAIQKKLKRVLFITDSALVANFLRGTSNIFKENLVTISEEIKSLFGSFEAIYFAKVPSHQGASLENDVADLLCSWAIETGWSVDHEGSLAGPFEFVETQNLAEHAAQLRRGLQVRVAAILDKMTAPFQVALTTRKCTYCSLDHTNAACPLKRFVDSDFSKKACPACCSPLHPFPDCPLLVHASRRPCLSSFTPLPPVPLDEQDALRASALFSADFDALRFPNRCSRKQFVDYFHVVFTAYEAATTPQQIAAVVRAVKAWNDHFYFQGTTIRRRKPRSDPRNRGDNLHPLPVDPELARARAALRAAFLLPKARMSDVSKALRTGPRIPLTDAIIAQLLQCYPVASDEEKIVFEPRPLAGFAVPRGALARAIMSRSPHSHPGATGLSFNILQCYCRWTYSIEKDSDSPDPRWDTLCQLVSKIMTGNATDLSDHFLDVVLAFFDKNAEKPGASPSIRNLGIEESLLRISAALVFEQVLPEALQRGLISVFDLGAGKKSGAEIFGRLAALFAKAGAPVAVFDVLKAFNHLRRKDIKDAVEAFNNPLLTAIVHFLFSKDSKVSFTCPISGKYFETWLTKGIHQGNPLSVFLFVLTIAFILKPFRAKHPDALVPAFVDDLIFTMAPRSLDSYPVVLQEFIQLFADHGLHFDLRDTAKSSVFSLQPLPGATQLQLNALGIRCQVSGITPCKIPVGSSAFIAEFTDKALTKLRHRFEAFKDLLPALCKLDRSRRTPSHRNYEHFLNLVRLSFLSMPTYTLRTLLPSACVTYSTAATEMALILIRSVLPPFVVLPPSSKVNVLQYPDLEKISTDIMQLPLTLGGLSLRLPSSIADLAYAASAADCLPLLHFAAGRIGAVFDYDMVPELRATRLRIQAALPAINPLFWGKVEDPLDGEFDDVHLQHLLTSELNATTIKTLSLTLKPWPAYYHAFSARTAKDQDHVSWPLNPKTRAFYGLGMLSDAEFSRSIALAILHPVLSPRYCPCGQPIDPAAFHLLHCHFNHYGDLHDCVKKAVELRLRSFMTDDAASFSVFVEKPLSSFFGRRCPAARNEPEGIADLILSMHSSLQQVPVAVDFVSCFPHKNSSYKVALQERARFKRRKYSGYLFPGNSFYPLPFGRTNVLADEVFEFCAFIGNFLPKHMRAEAKLRATFSRAIYAGTARLHSLAFRRLQLSAAQRLPLSAFSLSSLLDPYALEHSDRSSRRNPRWTSFTEASLTAGLAAALAHPDPAVSQVGFERRWLSSGRGGAEGRGA
jgi:ribonuclease HI